MQMKAARSQHIANFEHISRDICQSFVMTMALGPPSLAIPPEKENTDSNQRIP